MDLIYRLRERIITVCVESEYCRVGRITKRLLRSGLGDCLNVVMGLAYTSQKWVLYIFLIQTILWYKNTKVSEFNTIELRMRPSGPSPSLEVSEWQNNLSISTIENEPARKSPNLFWKRIRLQRTLVYNFLDVPLEVHFNEILLGGGLNRSYEVLHSVACRQNYFHRRHRARPPTMCLQ